jgi:hypothetical protein
MSSAEEFFAVPAFKPEAAMLQLQRGLRELRLLTERGSGYALQGRTVLELSRDEQTLTARIAKRPAQVPEWEVKVCRNSADIRALLDTIKLKLQRWTDE